MRSPLSLSIHTLHADAVTARVFACTQHEAEHALRNQFQSLRSGIELLSRAIQPGARTTIDPVQCLELLKGHLAKVEVTVADLLAFSAADSQAEAVFDLGAAINEMIDALPPSDQALIAGRVGSGHRVKARATLFRHSALALLLAAAESTPSDGRIELQLASVAPDYVAWDLRIAPVVEDAARSRFEEACAIVGEALCGSVVRLEIATAPAATTVRCVFTEIQGGLSGENERKPSRILVVDADKDAADSLAMVLELEGYEASAAYRGEEARSRVEREHFDALVINPELPDIDGNRLAEQLRMRGQAPLLIAVVDRPRIGGSGTDPALNAFDHLVPNTADLRFLRTVLGSASVISRD